MLQHALLLVAHAVFLRHRNHGAAQALAGQFHIGVFGTHPVFFLGFGDFPDDFRRCADGNGIGGNFLPHLDHSAFPDEALKAINTVEDEAIPDVNVRTTYADAIYRLYRAGILNGSDAKGTFYPTTYITRGAACAIATRMCDESLRKSVNLTKQDISVDISGSITIYENQYSPRLARAGDTYVKADGTKVILKVGPNGILGEGQGVAPDKNLKMENVWWTGNRLNFWASEVGRLTDSLGNHLQNANYIVNFTTGEGHWDTEWNVIYSQYTKPTKPGTYAGQVSTDPYHLWVWDGLFWSWNY